MVVPFIQQSIDLRKIILIKVNVCHLSRSFGQENSQGSLLTHQFSTGGRYKHSNYLPVLPSLQFCMNIMSDATFVFVYICPQGQYKICVNIDPLNFFVLNPHDNLVYFRAQNAVQLGPGIHPNNALSR